MELNTLAPAIEVYNDNSNWGKQCSDLINNNLLDLYSTGQVVKNYESATDIEYRKCLALGTDSAFTCHPEDPFYIINNILNQKTNSAINLYTRKYEIDRIAKNHGWILLNYKDGDYFKKHNDDCYTYPRTVSVVAYFNDDYDGGEIVFPSFSVEYKPKSGDILVFSSAYPYMHEIKPVLNGVRNAAVTWYSYAKL